MDSEQRSWEVRGGFSTGHFVEDSSVRGRVWCRKATGDLIGYWHRLIHSAGRFIWQHDEGLKDLDGLGGAGGRETL